MFLNVYCYKRANEKEKYQKNSSPISDGLCLRHVTKHSYECGYNARFTYARQR